MALTKNTLASASTIFSTVASAVAVETFTFAAQGDVVGVQPSGFATALSSATVTTSSFAGGIVPPTRITRPGIFTAGTPSEGTLSNPTNDSNS